VVAGVTRATYSSKLVEDCLINSQRGASGSCVFGGAKRQYEAKRYHLHLIRQQFYDGDRTPAAFETVSSEKSRQARTKSTRRRSTEIPAYSGVAHQQRAVEALSTGQTACARLFEPDPVEQAGRFRCLTTRRSSRSLGQRSRKKRGIACRSSDSSRLSTQYGAQKRSWSPRIAPHARRHRTPSRTSRGWSRCAASSKPENRFPPRS
jgi:hypothetical protein